jgi:glycine dehydrogenase
MGPIGVVKHLKEFLPSNPIVSTGGENAIHAISSAPWGSALVLTISYAYIRMLANEGLTQSTKIAILNANYLKTKLEKEYTILYASESGRVAHEMIVDFREYKSGGVEVTDIAKRLMDYGFHAPTVSFPVAGTLMIEPTESESLQELDRFIETMYSIKSEIMDVINNKVDKTNNVLKNAPHTMQSVIDSGWNKPYSREKAVFPLQFLKNNKFWPSVRRVDDAFGDRNLQCICLPVSDYNE